MHLLVVGDGVAMSHGGAGVRGCGLAVGQGSWRERVAAAAAVVVALQRVAESVCVHVCVCMYMCTCAGTCIYTYM